MGKKIEFQTQNGFHLTVDEETLSCDILREISSADQESPHLEQVRLSGVKVTGILFLGEGVRPGVAGDGLVLLPVENRSVSIPYKIGKSVSPQTAKKKIVLPVRALTDAFPVYIQHVADVHTYLRDVAEAERRRIRIVVIGPDVSRIDVTGVRVGFPHARIYHEEYRTAEVPTVPVQGRAADVVGQEGLEHAGKNPVYMARVLLRRFDYAGMEHLPVDYDLSHHDLEFIRAFIDTMYKNESNNPELATQHQKLGDLASFYTIVDLVVRLDRQGIDAVLEAGIPDILSKKLYPFIQKQRQRAGEGDAGLMLWELA